MAMRFHVKNSDLTDLDRIAAIFDEYRTSFGQASDLSGSHKFVSDRLSQKQSTIFLVEESATTTPVGFAQLYPSFASLAARPIWILNDLFVAAQFRRQGVASLLLNHIHAFARETGALRITLITEHTNTEAQALYESLGYKLDTAYRRYSFNL